MWKFQCSLSVVFRYSLQWSRTEVSKNGSDIHALTFEILQLFWVAVSIISTRLSTHSKTLPLEWGMEWISIMCVSWMRYILLLKDANRMIIGFLDGKRLENISLFFDDVKTFCTFQRIGGLILVLLHNRLVPSTSSMQSQFTLIFWRLIIILKKWFHHWNLSTVEMWWCAALKGV